MRITNLTPNKYKRFFTFGCSWTNYIWPTWADIIGQDIEIYENWGEQGGSNPFIFNSVIEAHARYNFKKDDLIIICWSSKEREPRYINNKWSHITPNNIKEKFGKDWIGNLWLEDRYYLLRDLAHIKSIHLILETLECDWASLIMKPIFNGDQPNLEFVNNLNLTKAEKVTIWFNDYVRNIYRGVIPPGIKHSDVIEMYKDVFMQISGDYEEYSVKHNCITWDRKDSHPHPTEVLGFIDYVWPDNTLSSAARQYATTWTSQLGHQTKQINRL